MAENAPKDFRWINQVVSDNPLLTKDEEARLFREIGNGCMLSREKVFLSNVRLVRSIARNYFWAGDIEDLLQEGFVGLNKAIQKYEYWMNNKFSTYASWWIKQAIRRYAFPSINIVKTNIDVNLLRRAYVESFNKLLMKLGRNPSEEELLKHTKMNLEQFRLAQRAMMNEMSIDSFSTEKPGLNKENLSLSYEEDDLQQRSRAVLSTVLCEFDERERTIIYLRFGIGCVPQTLKQIGVTLGLTRERVRQIEHAVLAELALYPSVRELVYHHKGSQ